MDRGGCAVVQPHKVWTGWRVVSEIVSAAIRRGIFDKDMFDKYGILTSRGIQKRYFEAVSRRKCVNVKKQYLLIPVDNLLKNVDINWVNDNINPKNDNNNPQSKVKESKGKKRKEYNEAAPADAGDGQEYLVRSPLKDGKNFTISEADVKQWEDLYPLVNVQQELKLMLGWSQGNPQKRKTMAGIKRFIHAWLARAKENGGKAMEFLAGLLGNSPEARKAWERYKGTEITSEEYLQRKIDRMNAIEGDLEGQDCRKCRNKGVIYFMQDGREVAMKCECLKARESRRRLKASGLEKLIERYRLDNFQCFKPWQEAMRRKAEAFLAEGGDSWFFRGRTAGHRKNPPVHGYRRGAFEPGKSGDLYAVAGRICEIESERKRAGISEIRRAAEKLRDPLH